MAFEAKALRGRFVRREKRFFVTATLEGVDDGAGVNAGETVVAHTSNTGAMTGMTEAGSAVLLTRSNNPKRRLQYTLEGVRPPAGPWIAANPIRSNAFASVAMSLGLVPGVRAQSVTREVRVPLPGHERSRLDLAVVDDDGARTLWEVKSVTLRQGQRAVFPDAPSARALRHVDGVRALVRAGQPAGLLFVVQRDDVTACGPAWSVDPAYAAGFRAALDEGVRAAAIVCRVDELGLWFGGCVPVDGGAP